MGLQVCRQRNQATSANLENFHQVEPRFNQDVAGEHNRDGGLESSLRSETAIVAGLRLHPVPSGLRLSRSLGRLLSGAVREATRLLQRLQ